MIPDKILNALSPCGINCEKCFANYNGQIKEHSKKLREFLGSFDVYAQRFAELLNEPEFLNYPQFKLLLEYFSNVSCRGCRHESCMIFQDCNVRDCSRQKGVNFCFECEEFPCDKTGFDEHLMKRWININKEMKTSGVEKFYKKIKNLPRY